MFYICVLCIVFCCYSLLFIVFDDCLLLLRNEEIKIQRDLKGECIQMLVYITGVDRSAFEEQGDHIINLRIRCPVPTLDLNAGALTT